MRYTRHNECCDAYRDAYHDMCLDVRRDACRPQGVLQCMLQCVLQCALQHVPLTIAHYLSQTAPGVRRAHLILANGEGKVQDSTANKGCSAEHQAPSRRANLQCKHHRGERQSQGCWRVGVADRREGQEVGLVGVCTRCRGVVGDGRDVVECWAMGAISWKRELDKDESGSSRSWQIKPAG